MKLRDAVVRGYTNDPDMMKELNDYKKSIGVTVYLEDKLYKPALAELYEKRKTEINAAHIMLIPDSTNNEQQLISLGNSLIERINKGEDFALLAKEFSKDQFSKERGGVVGWVTAGQIVVPEIEAALYNTELGKIFPKLVKTAYGYHILKVLDKKPRKEKIKVQHILALVRDSVGNADTVKAFAKIKDVQQKLNGGADFGQLAFEFSDDKSSAIQKGDLGFISRGYTVPQFEDAAFSLSAGEVSQIVKTEYGYHLIKVNEIAPYPSFQESSNELKEMFQRTSYKIEYMKVIDKLKSELGYKLVDSSYDLLLSKLDSIKVGPDYDTSWLKKEYGNKPIANFANRTYTIDSIMYQLDREGLYYGKKFDVSVLNEAIDQFSSDLLLKEKAMNYDKEDASFAQLMEEYENGIYLFKILEEEVWSKVKVDSAMTQNYFNNHRSDFKWKDRVEFKEVYVITDSLANLYYQKALSGEDFDSLAIKYSQRKGYENIPGYKGLVEIDFNELAKQANSLKDIGDISKPFRTENGWSFVKLIKREKARLKNYDEVKTEIASLLQERESKRMEEEYINRLKAVYKPTAYYEELKNAFKK
jgi:peptidyl-prolyl cis-trans isomerase SurA